MDVSLRASSAFFANHGHHAGVQIRPVFDCVSKRTSRSSHKDREAQKHEREVHSSTFPAIDLVTCGKRQVERDVDRPSQSVDVDQDCWYCLEDTIVRPAFLREMSCPGCQ